MTYTTPNSDEYHNFDVGSETIEDILCEEETLDDTHEIIEVKDESR